MKRFLAVLLCAALLFGTTGCCCIMPDLLDASEWLDTSETSPKDAQSAALPFTFTLTEADVDTFYSMLEESEAVALVSTDYDHVDALTDALDDQYTLLEDQCAIAQLLYYCDMTDTQASQLYLDCVDICADANNAYMEMARRLYLSDAPTKDQLFADWTQEELDMLMAYTEEIMILQKRNSELLVEYQSLSDPTSDAMIPLYIEHVQNSNRMAQIYGYENYYEYAYQLGYERDYDEQELYAMRDYVARYLVPIYENAYNAFSVEYEAMDMDMQNQLANFMSGYYKQNNSMYFDNYMDTLPSEMSEIMQEALGEQYSYFTNNPNAFEGAFTTVVEDRSFCFFGPGYQNAMTVAHELGHYYGSAYMDLNEIPLDLAETHSQGNEWLFLGYLEEDMDADVYSVMCNYKMFNDLATLQICVLVDEFEQRIYTEPNLDSFTAADFNQVMTEICANYGGEEFISYWLTDIQSYWRMVVMEAPVYYISYAVSAVASMNFYTMYADDPEMAVETYRRLIENPDEAGFLTTIEAAGLPGPFDESFYQDIAEIYS